MEGTFVSPSPSFFLSSSFATIFHLIWLLALQKKGKCVHTYITRSTQKYSGNLQGKRVDSSSSSFEQSSACFCFWDTNTMHTTYPPFFFVRSCMAFFMYIHLFYVCESLTCQCKTELESQKRSIARYLLI